MTNVNLGTREAQITADALNLILNDPDWQDMLSASNAEWAALNNAATKIAAVARRGGSDA